MHLFIVKHVDGRNLAFTSSSDRDAWMGIHGGDALSEEATLYPSAAHAEMDERGRWNAALAAQEEALAAQEVAQSDDDIVDAVIVDEDGV